MTLPHASRMRYRSLAWVVSACFLAVFARLVWLHWVDAPELRAEAMQARRVRQELPCRRGEVRDAQDNLLAVSEDVWDIGVDPVALDKKDAPRAGEVALALGVPVLKVLEAYNPRPASTTRASRARSARRRALAGAACPSAASRSISRARFSATCRRARSCS